MRRPVASKETTAWVQQTFSAEALHDVVDVCDAHGIDVLPVKGIVTGRLLYDDRGMRAGAFGIDRARAMGAGELRASNPSTPAPHQRPNPITSFYYERGSAEPAASSARSAQAGFLARYMEPSGARPVATAAPSGEKHAVCTYPSCFPRSVPPSRSRFHTMTL